VTGPNAYFIAFSKNLTTLTGTNVEIRPPSFILSTHGTAEGCGWKVESFNHLPLSCTKIDWGFHFYFGYFIPLEPMLKSTKLYF
jgi:hypothetical protein